MASKQNESMLRKRVETYLAVADAVRATQSERLIHDFRVASREMIALEPLLRFAGAKKKTLKKMKKWLKAFSTLRNLQMLQLMFADSARLQKLLQKEFTLELAGLQPMLQSMFKPAYQEQLKRLAEQTDPLIEQNKPALFSALLDNWQETVEELRQTVDALDADQPSTLHKVRIRFKRFRYLTQYLKQSGMLVLPLKKSQLKHWQESLGYIQDRVAAVEWLEKHPRTLRLRQTLQREITQASQRFVAEKALFLALIDQVDAQVRHALSSPPA